MTLVRLHPMDGRPADTNEIWGTPPLPRSEALEVAPRLLLEHPKVRGIWLYRGGSLTDTFDLDAQGIVTHCDLTHVVAPEKDEIRMRGFGSGRMVIDRFDGKRWEKQ